jgi:hypothetical protein
MRKEDLAYGKKYRHHAFNVDLTLTSIGLTACEFSLKIHENHTTAFIYLDNYEIEKITEVREKIKVECDVFLCVDPTEEPRSKMDKTFGICTDDEVYFNKEHARNSVNHPEEIKKFKATFEEVDDE